MSSPSTAFREPFCRRCSERPSSSQPIHHHVAFARSRSVRTDSDYETGTAVSDIWGEGKQERHHAFPATETAPAAVSNFYKTGFIYINIYIYMCVCACVWPGPRTDVPSLGILLSRRKLTQIRQEQTSGDLSIRGEGPFFFLQRRTLEAFLLPARTLPQSPARLGEYSPLGRAKRGEGQVRDIDRGVIYDC